MLQDFTPGQRWMSDAEAGLGLGTVLKVDERQVHIQFPASGENRIYARRGSPLIRVRFVVGDRLEDKHNRQCTVTDVLEEANLLAYRVQHDNGQTSILPEGDLNDRLRLNRPLDKLGRGRVDEDIWFRLRYRTWLKRAEEEHSALSGLAGPRVGLIPHQLHIAAEVTGRHAPRVLLADEVGLGKTIEAGLIMHRLLLQERIRRVLIIVPESLLHQWLVEMRRRFNLSFALFDDERFAAADAENPFQAEQRVLCSLEFLVSRPDIARGALSGSWDMLVVDEAHHLHWDEQGSSLEYDLIEALAEQVPGVLLLTATPEQLGRAGHFARLRLLDPHRFHDYAAFVAEEQAYAPIAELAARLLDEEPLGESQQTLLNELLGNDLPNDRQKLIDRLVDRHGTGRVLFRNTRAAIKGFPEREVIEYPLPCPSAYPTQGQDIDELLTPERSLADASWTDIDPRTAWLADTLRALRPEKVLVICAHADSALELADALHQREGIHAAVFHEHMSIIERDRAAAYFAADEEGTQVLICSEIGSEGRNFQFAHHLVLFDLPFHPDLLEQRIGRLDRIGQNATIRIHIPYLQGSAGERLLRFYRDGLHALGAISPAAGAVHTRLAESLAAALQGTDGLDALVRDADELTARLNTELEAGRDRLLELQSHHPETAQQRVESLQQSAAVEDLRDYLWSYWDAFGVNHEAGPERSLVLSPGRHMRLDRFPGLPDDGVTVTFERDDALAHENWEFLTWEHPMTRAAMDLLSADDLGSAALVLASHPDFRPGTPLVELLFIVESSAPGELAIGRFMPPTCLRLLLDAKGRDRCAEYSHEVLQGRCLSRNRKLSDSLLGTLGGRLKEWVEKGKKLAAKQGQAVVDSALARMQDELAEDIDRLRELARVNPNVREDEIEYQVTRRDALAGYLQKSRVRLDAIRVIVMQ